MARRFGARDRAWAAGHPAGPVPPAARARAVAVTFVCAARRRWTCWTRSARSEDWGPARPAFHFGKSRAQGGASGAGSMWIGRDWMIGSASSALFSLCLFHAPVTCPVVRSRAYPQLLHCTAPRLSRTFIGRDQMVRDRYLLVGFGYRIVVPFHCDPSRAVWFAGWVVQIRAMVNVVAQCSQTTCLLKLCR